MSPCRPTAATRSTGSRSPREAREPDPQRLLGVYHASAAILNLTRAFVTGGFAHLRSVHSWNADFVKNSAAGVQYQNLASEIDRALAFMVACGIDDDVFRTVDFYSSHEALILEYEHALTRIDSRTQRPYDTSGHFVWIGERTRQLDGAHVELLRHVRNPIGVKLGPETTPDFACELADRLDPDHEPGRITFITRMGAAPGARRAARHRGQGRGQRTAGRLGLRSDARQHLRGPQRVQDPGVRRRDRRAERLLRRARGAGQLARWGARGAHRRRRDRVRRRSSLGEADLVSRYETLCDPRLNRNQSLELAFLVADRLTTGRIRRPNPIQAYSPVSL